AQARDRRAGRHSEASYKNIAERIMTCGVAGGGLLPAENAAAEQVHRGVGRHVAGAILDEAADRAASQEIHVDYGHLPCGGQRAAAAAAVSCAVTGLHREVAQGNEIEQESAL